MTKKHKKFPSMQRADRDDNLSGTVIDIDADVSYVQ